MISLTAGVATDVGLVRASNEDSVLVSAPVFAVADGMGGYAGGATASAIAVEHLRRMSEVEALSSQDIYAALVRANQEIVRRGLDDPDVLGMGTTVAGLALVRNGDSDYWLVFNVGDSRVYRLDEDGLVQVSVDHSLTQELIDEGRIDVDAARTHPDRNVVTRALGSEPDVAPDLWLMPPAAGETFLLCSDGLTRELTEGEVETVLRGASDPQAACDQLVSAALKAGGRDNVSVIVVQVDSASSPDEATVPPPVRAGSSQPYGAVGERPSSGPLDADTNGRNDASEPEVPESPEDTETSAAVISTVPLGPGAPGDTTEPTQPLDVIQDVPRG